MVKASSEHPMAFLGEYGIKYYKSIEEYQQYIGQSVIYLASEYFYGKIYDEKFEGTFDEEYVISKITGNDKKMKIFLIPKCGGKSVTINIDWKGNSLYTITPQYTLPLLLVDKLNETKEKYVGTKFGNYEIIDVLPYTAPEDKYRDNYKYEKQYPTIKFKLKNDKTIKYITERDVAIYKKACGYIGEIYPKYDDNSLLSKFADKSLYYKVVDFEIGNFETLFSSRINLILEHSIDKNTTKTNLESLDIFNELGKVLSLQQYRCTYKVLNVYKEKDEYKYKVINNLNKKIKEFSVRNIDDANYKAFAGDSDGNYIVTLKKVEKPTNVAIRYGKTKSITDEGVNKYSYTDNILSLLIFATQKGFSFSLENLSSSTIKIIWDEAVFVDVDGSTSKVMHNGVKYMERESSQQPSVIIKASKIEDIAIPTSKVYYSDGWYTKNLCSNVDRTKEGQKLKLMLPIQIKEVINEYIFEFDTKYEYLYPELLKL